MADRNATAAHARGPATPTAPITIHIVDDNQTLQDALHDVIYDRFKTFENPPRVRGERYVWDLLDSGEVQPGDIAVCDLYPAGYWADVPGTPLYSRVDVLGDDIQDMVRASFDLAQRFLRPLQHDMKADVIVFTFVPEFMRRKGREVEAIAVLEALEAQHLYRVIQKADQSTGEHNLAETVDAVMDLLKRRGIVDGTA